MTRDGKIGVAAILLALGTFAALAANDTIGVSPGVGKIGNLIKFGSGNVISEVGICDATTENACAAVTASALNVSLPSSQVINTGTAGTAATDVLTVQGIASMTPLIVNQGTSPWVISASTLPLPTGAATSALQSTINTTLGSPFQAGGSIGNTSFTANAGTDLNTSALALESGGNLATIAAAFYAQGSTTAGQLGPLAQCAVTAAQPTPLTLTTAPLNCSTLGALRVATTGNSNVQGTAANNAALSGNPVNLGAQAVSSENAAVTTARQVQLVADLVGKLIVLPYANPENFVSGTTAAMTGTTSTALLGSPGGSLRNYVTQISCVNSHATVGTFVTVQDGVGGTALATLAAASVYGGETISFPVPLRQPTVATSLNVADVTTGANVICSATGYKGL